MKKIFILHGWTYDTAKWKPLLSLLKKHDYAPILLCVPGLTGPIDRAWTINDYVNWLNNEIKNENKPVTILGHSNGGRLAMNFAVAYPKKIKKLILIDSAGIRHNGLPIRIKRTICRTIAKLGRHVTSSENIRHLFYRLIRETDYRNAKPNMRITMQQLIDSDQNLDFSGIRNPTTIIWGEKDKITPIKDGEKIAAFISNANLYRIPDAGHAPFATHPDEVVRIINKSLRI